MKSIVLLLCLSISFLACESLSKGYDVGRRQNDKQLEIKRIFLVDSLTREGTDIIHWKIKAGKSAFHTADSTAWDSIVVKNFFDETLYNYFKKDGYVWLKTTIYKKNPDPKTILLAFNQTVASEVYLNENKLKTYGTTEGNILAYNPLNEPFWVSLDSLNEFRIAVKLALPEYKAGYSGGFGKRSIFSLWAYSDDYDFAKNIDPANNSTFWSLVKIGIFLILCIIHYNFFKVQKDKKSNLYFALFCTCLLIYECFRLYAREINHSPEYYPVIDTILILTGPTLASIFFMIAIYKEFGMKYGVLFYLTVFGFLAVPAVSFFTSNITEFFYKIVINLFFHIVAAILTLRALDRDKPGAGIFALGVLSPFLILILSIVILIVHPSFFGDSGKEITINMGRYLSYAILNGKDVLLSICLSLYISLEFTQVNRSLTRKLLDINKLSEEKQSILESQKQTLEKQVVIRTQELNKTIETLKTTQDQLVQKEKLASLGELTAGIAHEIQNPLNFVNNFSELSIELIEELNENTDPEIEKELLTDLAENQNKINFHGKRASNIVKGMLSHSRASSGERIETNINELADEYLRLSFHGMRAKDKNFNSDYKIYTDSSLPLLNIVPQDIGRVLLNLINNSFYSVFAKSRLGIENYKPLVEIFTEKEDNYAIIRVKDNGLGIPADIKAKVFQPFFTTKPTGEGTGLGLSLSYDIVTKGHGGQLEVKSEINEYCEFIIKLPIK